MPIINNNTNAGRTFLTTEIYTNFFGLVTVEFFLKNPYGIYEVAYNAENIIIEIMNVHNIRCLIEQKHITCFILNPDNCHLCIHFAFQYAKLIKL